MDALHDRRGRIAVARWHGFDARALRQPEVQARRRIALLLRRWGVAGGGLVETAFWHAYRGGGSDW
jgi:hypothetical protein